MLELLRLFWPAHFVLLVSAYVWMLVTYRDAKRFRHVVFIATSYVILTGIDVYTILIERYPVWSFKACLMLFAFSLGIIALTDLLFLHACSGDEDAIE